MNIGESIKRHRLEKQLTQSKLAEITKISESAIRKYEKGERQPKLEQLTKIANALDIPISDLIPEAPKTYLVPNQEKLVKNLLSITEKSRKETDPYYDLRHEAWSMDLVNSILDIAKTETSFWKETTPLDAETLARYFKAIMITIGLTDIVSINDKDINTLLYSEEYKNFIDLLILKYNTSTKDSDK